MKIVRVIFTKNGISVLHYKGVNNEYDNKITHKHLTFHYHLHVLLHCTFTIPRAAATTAENSIYT